MSIQGFDPRTGAAVGAPVAETGAAEVDAICARAAGASRLWARTPAAVRAAALESIAAAIDANAVELAALGDRETALGLPRLSGEIKRTTNQLRLFADVLREGSYVEATLDAANPASVPPCPELRRMLQPIGPVAVFAASNFPFAFSVAGGDTASALAAGCSVIVKAHEAHPQTARATAAVVAQALADAGAPAGVFDIVHGVAAGARLVGHPAVKAAGFTGSTRGGRALFDLANARPAPIPFYGELGSINPVLVLPHAAAERAQEIARGFAASLTLGVGQFCTNPGLLFVPVALVDELAAAVRQSGGGALLTQRMQESYRNGTQALAAVAERVASGADSDAAFGAMPQLFRVDLESFAADMERHVDECFGPAALVVAYRDVDGVLALLDRLPGTLTASVHATAADAPHALRAVDALRGIAGRVVYNAWPTGVAVAWGMQHGGPWPATTNPLHTSVGATAIRRWLVPVSFQDWPDALLPDELKDANPLRIPRRRDGVPGLR
ncbi:aldehyde dehydrogenase (NADP(+)) [Rhodanobacter sp. DHB23]|uniref:aldehyde dehydrogenase (NADP(+)) n=1 Tax=Rhodanobacter sp. DHB23 TaxID=2775923 RepID=UPI0017841711|nr:aldehyde dehydrogenase (NADP(+)) [Rhodanobacter sp. DHB23]MBD8873489.1 aldehyde dehydrogenase (NADP(+)) [Rhodanobacter sp. DHB23]